MRTGWAASARAAYRPPKPPPTITTCGGWPGRLVVVADMDWILRVSASLSGEGSASISICGRKTLIIGTGRLPERDHDFVGSAGCRCRRQCLLDVCERETVANDRRELLPVLSDVVGHLEDFRRVAHRSDDVDFGVEDRLKVDADGFFVDGDNADRGTVLRGRQGGF